MFPAASLSNLAPLAVRASPVVLVHRPHAQSSRYRLAFCLRRAHRFLSRPVMSEWSPASLLIASVIAAGVGFLSGVFGVGGGFLLVPVLNAALGVPMPIAVGSTACYTLGPATTAMLARKPRSGFIELPLILAGGLFAGVLCGASAVSRLASLGSLPVLGRVVPAVDLMVLTGYFVLMTAIAAISLRDGLRRSSQALPRRGLFAHTPVPPMAIIPDLSPAVHSIPLLALTGLMVGFLSGFLGMSGGLVLVPAAIYLLGLRVHDATTVTIAIVWLVSVLSTIMHAVYDNVRIELVAILLVSGAIGAAAGSQIGLKLKGRQLKVGFGLLVLVAALIVASRLASLWTAAG